MTQQSNEPVKAPSLAPTHANFGIAEQIRTVYRANIPAGVPMDRLLEPDYWAHVAERLRPGFIIEVLAQDGSYFGELLVRKAAKTEVHCWLLRHVPLVSAATAKAAAPAAPGNAGADDFKVEFGGAHKWRVVDTRTNEVVHKGEPSEHDAREWLAKYLEEVHA